VIKSKNITLICKTPKLDLQKIQIGSYLSQILSSPTFVNQFWDSIEMVNRNYITNNRKCIEGELNHHPLRSFRFIINKN